MLRKLTLLILPLALFAVACGGSSSNSDVARDSSEDAAANSAGPDGIYGTADDGLEDILGDGDSVVADPVSDSGIDDGTSNVDKSDSVSSNPNPKPHTRDDSVVSGGGLDESDLLGAVNPFMFLGGVGSSSVSTQVSADLAAALLNDADLPGGFSSMGDFSFSAPSEFGDMEIAARMFASGLSENDFGAMVISAAMTLPPEAMGELDQLTGLTDADLQEIRDTSAEFGLEYGDLSILNSDGLGEAGFGMHMELDFGELFSAFGATEDDIGFTGFAMDMYAFVVGDRVLMVMVMWPSGESPGVDGRQLAEVMDSRA